MVKSTRRSSELKRRVGFTRNAFISAVFSLIIRGRTNNCELQARIIFYSFYFDFLLNIYTIEYEPDITLYILNITYRLNN